MILVTGGAGFIGSNLIQGLNQSGIKDIIVVDNMAKAEKHKNLNTLHFSDYVDKRYFYENMQQFSSYKFDTVFHQGACSNTMETDGLYMMQNNYEFSKKVLQFCVENRCKFIYASSASVYGNGTNGFGEERRNEYPLNIYAYSKFLFDQYIRNVLQNAKIQITGLRYFNVYGPQENHKQKMASVIFHFHNQIIKDGTLKIFEGSEGFLRDFIYVKDIVKINQFFMNNSVNGIFNCGTGKAESFMKIAEIMEKLYDKVAISKIPFPEALQGKYQTYTQADISSLRTAGFTESFTSLENGVGEYVSILKKSEGYYL